MCKMIYTNSFDRLQLSRFGKHAYTYVHTLSASHTGNTYYSITKAFRTTSLQSLSETNNIFLFLPYSAPGEVTGLSFICLELEDFVELGIC